VVLELVSYFSPPFWAETTGRKSLREVTHSVAAVSWSQSTMGMSQSKSDTDEKVFYNESPIQVLLLSAITLNTRSDIETFFCSLDVTL
jgi:hypothetical protein